MKKRLLSILLVLLTALTLLPLGALAEDGNKCGENLTWEFADGILTISGTGDMYDYSEEPAPWSEYSDIITSITIDYGVTSIGTSAFTGCSNIQQIKIPDSVEHIDPYAFSFCKGLHTVQLPSSLTLISEELFAECDNLRNLSIPDTVTEIGANAFLRCTAFILEKLPAGIKSIGDAAFANCGNIESLALPGTLESIGNAAFTGTVIGKASFDGTLEKWKAIGGDACCIAQDKIDFLEHTCDFSGWKYDEHKHWQQCSCNKTQNEGEHTGDGEICDVCGAALAEALGSGSIDGGLSWSLSRSGALTISGSGKVFKQGSVIFALGHDPQSVRVKAPTCTESGYTGDLICMRCGDMTQIGKTVAAAGHKFFGGVCSVCGTKGAEAAPEFDDVKPGAFYFDAVQWAVKNGITNGTGKSTFSPNSVCSRYQIVMFLWRAAGQPEAKAAVSFADVKPGDIFYEAVQWAVERGITKGTSSTSFSPYAPCTRGQIVTFLYRSAGSPKVSGACNFSDVSAGSFCHDAVIWASSEGITNGTSAGRFSPNEGCTRAQVVTFLYRASGGK